MHQKNLNAGFEMNDLPAHATPSKDLAASVIIPTFNRAHLVPRAIESALRAMAPGDELIVVDDGSTDATRTAVERFGDRVRYIRIANGGAGRARNVGLENAIKPLVAFLDSDDTWAPFKLKLQRAVLREHPQLVYCCSNFSLCTPAGDTPSYLRNWWSRNTDPANIFGAGQRFHSSNGHAKELPVCNMHVVDLFKPMMEDGVICLITLLYRRERAPNVNFPEDLQTYEDWEFCARLARQGPGAYLDCDTAINHAHTGPRLTDAHALTCAATRLKVMPRVWGNDPQFMARYSSDYDSVWSEQCIRAAHWLIRHGRNPEAREYLAKAGHAPLGLRLIASLPIPQSAIELARKSRDVLFRKS
jgi:glycosyltransferase involved in cell wall biosynthesis